MFQTKDNDLWGEALMILRQKMYPLSKYISTAVWNCVDDWVTEFPTQMDMDFNIESATKKLGIYWNTNHDWVYFRLTFNCVNAKVVYGGCRRPTKIYWEILSTTISVYDPGPDFILLPKSKYPNRLVLWGRTGSIIKIYCSDSSTIYARIRVTPANCSRS